MNSIRVPTADIVRKMTAPQKKFAVEFYWWALEDAEREFSRGFPFLSRIKSMAVSDYLEFVRALSPSEKRLFRLARVKWAHAEGCLLAGDSVTEKEEVLDLRYRERNIRNDPVWGRVAVLSRAEKEWAKTLASGNSKYAIDRKGLRAVLKQKLPPILGSSTETFGSSVEWRYITPIGRWTVYTWIDTGGRRSHLKYGHTVSLRPHVDLVEHMSILQWLGLGGHGWNLLTEADVPEAAQLVADLSSHFLNAVSKIQGRIKANRS